MGEEEGEIEEDTTGGEKSWRGEEQMDSGKGNGVKLSEQQ